MRCRVRLETAVLLGTILLLAVVTLPRLPAGVCYGDPGDLQLAAATLGIMHPPGYVGYVSLLFPATLLPFVSPAFMTSLMILLSGLACAWMGMRWLCDLGVSPWLGAAAMLAWAAQPRVWHALLVPEIYILSLMLTAASALCLLRYGQHGRRGMLWAAALLYGVVLANRPTVILLLPFVLIAWWLLERRLGRSPRAMGWHLLATAGWALLPAVYSVGYLLVRDTPRISYNYLEEHNVTADVLPEHDDGFAARWERVVWLMSARQFHGGFGTDLGGLRSKLRWIRNDLLPPTLPYRAWTFAVLGVLAVIGLVLMWRRCAVSGWLLLGLVLHAVVFVCIYRVHGQAADLLPVQFAGLILLAASLSPLLPATARGWRPAVAMGLAVVLGVWSVLDAGRRVPWGQRESAAPFLAEADVSTLPRNAVILADWHHAPPLWYATRVATARRDIEVLAAHSADWPALREARADRVVLTVLPSSTFREFQVTPYRNLYRVEAPESGTP